MELDDDVKEKVLKSITSMAPSGSRFSIEGVPLEWVLELTCDGADPEMGYYCCLAPGHDERRGCYSAQKKVNFRRNNDG